MYICVVFTGLTNGRAKKEFSLRRPISNTIRFEMMGSANLRLTPMIWDRSIVNSSSESEILIAERLARGIVIYGVVMARYKPRI